MSGEGSLKSYIWGFILSIALTLASYFLVSGHHAGRGAAIAAILVFALAQLFVQLWFFLHLGKEPKPYWNNLALVFAAGVVIMIVVGSIWIMYHLSYNMQPDEANHYVQREEAIHR